MRRDHQDISGKGVKIYTCYDSKGWICGYLIPTHQPTPLMLINLECLHADYKGKLARVDLAADFVPADRSPDELRDWHQRHMILRGQPSKMFEEDETVYWVNQQYRTSPKRKEGEDGKLYWTNPQKRSNRDIAAYSDRASKVHGLDVAHCELRFLSPEALRAQNIHRPTDLIGLDPAPIFARNIKLVDMSAADRKRKQFIRQIIADINQRQRSPREYQSPEYADLMDRYRANWSRRAASIWDRAGLNNAQDFNRTFPATSRRMQTIPIDVLQIPHRITTDLVRNGDIDIAGKSKPNVMHSAVVIFPEIKLSARNNDDRPEYPHRSTAPFKKTRKRRRHRRRKDTLWGFI